MSCCVLSCRVLPTSNLRGKWPIASAPAITNFTSSSRWVFRSPLEFCDHSIVLHDTKDQASGCQDDVYWSDFWPDPSRSTSSKFLTRNHFTTNDFTESRCFTYAVAWESTRLPPVGDLEARVSFFDKDFTEILKMIDSAKKMITKDHRKVENFAWRKTVDQKENPCLHIAFEYTLHNMFLFLPDNLIQMHSKVLFVTQLFLFGAFVQFSTRWFDNHRLCVGEVKLSLSNVSLMCIFDRQKEHSNNGVG